MTPARLLMLLAVLTVGPAARAADPPKPVKVFVLAGQSNMEGQAVVDLGGKDYNDGRGTLRALLNDPAKAPLVKHLRTGKGAWTVRDDVWVRYQREKQPLLAGPLTVGFTVYGGTHHFGPELQFGHVVGDHLTDQVLLVKTAWGGKSLSKDFRPPSSGGQVGPYYTRMIAEVREALANLTKDFPAYVGQGYELAGFVWYHGWNDGVDPKRAVPEYEQNLVNLINDVRKDLKAPTLPVVIGELTGPWVDAPGEWAALRKAQAGAAARPEFNGTVRWVPTRDFVRPAQESPNPTHGHHEFGNAETYVLVGDALGKGMVRLLQPPPVTKTEVPPKTQFKVAGHPAFVLMPARVDEKRPVPWVWYAPTFPNLPEVREHWMFEQFLAAGIAIAGVDVGESYGSPTGRATYSALYKELVTGRNFAKKPVLLARSRGGLMLYNWAAENPDAVGAIAGIYPVCDLRSYPGLDRACGAYGLTRAELEGQLDKHNPVARLAPLAKAGVPIFHVHGDEDAVVPLEANSGELARRYEKLGGKMVLRVAAGQGHNYWDGFFRCQELVDFVLARSAARGSAGAVDALAGKRVVFLGDSITQAGGHVAFATYYLERLHPDKAFDILGLGLASETLSGLTEVGHAGGKFPRPCLFERLGRVLEKAKPEVVFACYGMNDGIYLPHDRGRFATFQTGVKKLIDQCQAAGVKQIYLVTPPIYDFLPKPGEFNYDAVLTEYAKWEAGLKLPGVAVIDLHTAMRATRAGRDKPFSPDKVHPGDDGHLLIARTVLTALGETAPDGTVAAIKADKLFKLVDQKRALRSAAWMKHIGYTREKVVAPEPLGTAEADAAKVQEKIDALRRTK